MPNTPDEWNRTSEEFMTTWNFPHCLGAIDGKHIAIRKPVGTGSYFFNYKKFFSIVLIAVVNANYEFIMTDVGRVSDGGVIAVTEFGRRMELTELNLPEPKPIVQNGNKMPFVFVADDAFAMSENILKPYGGDKLDHDQRVFNYRLSRARRVSEYAFGILSARFGVFRRAIQLSPEKATTITLACCYLHNFLRKKSKNYLRPGSVDWEDTNHEVHLAEWRDHQNQLERLGPCRSRNIGAGARAVRDSFREYFCTQGRVHWQEERIA
ncbi:protein ALP1-like [Elysia marginata]|uniref:Protein ALP1-like n=1 Tax=Elysia marginata TaxID=1093978 RepID=A0AAV4IDN4_9GAST|nr:protein ALP1-like [Elysia marginata]